MSDETKKIDDGNQVTPEAASTEPADLAEAMRLTFESQQKDDEKDLEGAGKDAAGEGRMGGDNDEGENKPNADPVTEPAGPADGDAGGGQAADTPPTAGAGGGGAGVGKDFNPDDVIKQLGAYIDEQAKAAAIKEFEDNGIKPFDINSLYTRDERTGKAEFKNPDDPDRPFGSRAEAQAWVEAMNKQIQTALHSRFNEHRQQLAKDEAPSIELMKFIPTYQKLDPTTRQIFDGIISEFAIQKNGQLVGYGCNLNAALKQTQAVMKNLYKIQQQKQQPAEPGDPAPATDDKGPALDMKSRGGGGEADKEPANLAEAIKMQYEQEAAVRKGKDK
jgi:hypothetical protein